MLFDDPDDDLVDEEDSVSSVAADDGLLSPRLASTIFGHESVEKNLLALYQSGKMPHAMIFSGLSGIGKSTMAFRLAKFLLAQKKDEDAGPSLFGAPEQKPAPTTLTVDPELQAARLVTSAGHPDLLVLERKVDEKSGATKESLDVEQVRSVAPFLQMTPFMGGWRVVIVDDADTMTRSSQNALLKVLEEPPANSILVLIAHRAGQLIPTIRSRSRVIDFAVPTIGEFENLMKKSGVQGTEIESLYNISGGSIGVAQRLSESGALKSLDQVVKLLTPWPALNWTDIHMMGEVLNAKGQDNGLQGFQDVLTWSIDQITMSKARGTQSLPAPLNTGLFQKMLADHTLAQWSKISEDLKAHFATVKYGTLDRRQAVFGAFSILMAA